MLLTVLLLVAPSAAFAVALGGRDLLATVGGPGRWGGSGQRPGHGAGPDQVAAQGDHVEVVARQGAGRAVGRVAADFVVLGTIRRQRLRRVGEQVQKLTIYNTLGQVVKEYTLSNLKAGLNTVKWNGRSNDGNQVSSGLYFAVLQVSNLRQSTKLLLLK